jgi:tetratricopeptide (TPR) repeat protein
VFRLSVEELLSKFFMMLNEVASKGSHDEGLVKEVLSTFKEAMESDSEGRYSILNLLLINLDNDLLRLKPEEVIDYLLKSYDGLVRCFKKVLKLWLENYRTIIEYLDSVGVVEHPLTNVFILSEVLGLLDPLNPESYVIRGNIYLNYLKILKEYEGRSGLLLREQSERAFKNAYSLFMRAISLDVNSYEGYLGLARLYMLVGDLENAIKNYENALRCRRTPEVLKELADVYKLKGNTDLASKYLREYEDIINKS